MLSFVCVLSFRESAVRCKSMESLTQEQNKNSTVFYTTAEDSSSESNISELSRNRDEETTYSRKQVARSRTPEPRRDKNTSDFTTSPQISPRLRRPVAFARSVPTLGVPDRGPRSPPRVSDSSVSSRVSYEGSSAVEYQVRYVGGYRSGSEDNADEPIRLLPYDRSPMHSRRDSLEARLSDDYYQVNSSASEYSISYTESPRRSRDERVESPVSFSRSPTSSPHLRRKAVNAQSSPKHPSFADSPPVPAQKQKKTAIVSPLLDIADSRPRSVPPGVFDPSDPESERVEQVSSAVTEFNGSRS